MLCKIFTKFLLNNSIKEEKICYCVIINFNSFNMTELSILGKYNLDIWMKLIFIQTDIIEVILSDLPPLWVAFLIQNLRIYVAETLDYFFQMNHLFKPQKSTISSKYWQIFSYGRCFIWNQSKNVDIPWIKVCKFTKSVEMFHTYFHVKNKPKKITFLKIKSNLWRFW